MTEPIKELTTAEQEEIEEFAERFTTTDEQNAARIAQAILILARSSQTSRSIKVPLAHAPAADHPGKFTDDPIASSYGAAVRECAARIKNGFIGSHVYYYGNYDEADVQKEIADVISLILSAEMSTLRDRYQHIERIVSAIYFR